jgi:hypothetical protein
MITDTQEKEKRVRAVTWVSEGAEKSRSIIVCSSEADARRLNRITAFATVAFATVPESARERLEGRHVILALRDGAAGSEITTGLNKVAGTFASYKLFTWPDKETDEEIRSASRWITNPLEYTQLPVLPTATALLVKVTTDGQREKLAEYIKAHPGRFPLHIHDGDTRRIVRVKESFETLTYCMYWFGKRGCFYVRAPWAFGA